LTPAHKFHDGLIEMGWRKTLARDDGAYVRNNDRFLTWTKDGVLIATSGTSKYYDADRGVVMGAIGGGHEVTLEALITDSGARRQGRAREALQAWLALATYAKLDLFIEPVPLEDGISRESLVAFYRTVGFHPCDEGCRVMSSTIRHA